MAFFKFRFPGSTAQGEAAPAADSVEALRRRARHRLIGAVALVLAAVIGLPLVFDTQPRPVSVDVPIVIPDRNKVAPLPATLAPPHPASVSAAGGASASRSAPTTPGASAAPAAAPQPIRSASVSAQASLDDREELVAQKSAEKPPNPSANRSSPAPHSVAKPAVAASVAKSSAPPASAPARKNPAPPGAAPTPREDGERARALLEGKDVPKASATGAPSAHAATGSARYIVQVGAFADAAKARETRLKVEHAGMTTYTQVAETAEGKRIRVRVGPFTDRAEAEKAAARVRALGLPAALLTL